MLASAPVIEEEPSVSEIHAGPAFTSYRDAVMERLHAGEPVREVQHDIDGIAELPEDEKDALWLFAFAKRDASRSRRTERARVSVIT